MSNTLSLKVRLKILTALAENSGVWITMTNLAKKANSQPERIQPTLESFSRLNIVKSLDWEKTSKEKRKEIMDEQKTREITPDSKILYKIDQDGWQSLKNSLQDCFEDDNVFNLMNIPKEIKDKLF
ncbi:MAG: hypothetical protein HOB51_00655 [Thaumarchaeota archaeon]|nr:hypothetical protein [Nitrososphaerota archaeon]